jgi:hypothetical protein
LQNTFQTLKETTTKSIAILLLIAPTQNTLLESPSKTSERKMKKMKWNCITSQEHNEGTKKTPNAHHRFFKASFVIHKMLLQILLARFTMREHEREGEERINFGIIDLL